MATRKTRPTAARTAPAPKKQTRRSGGKPTSKRRWSQRVTATSDAMDLDQGVFTLRSPTAVARSLKRSAEHSSRRKSAPFRSAMSMLNFEINRAGKGMPAARRRVLEAAKDELRRLFKKLPAVKVPGVARRKPGAQR